MIIWADIQPRSATDILKDISHFSVSSVKDGELTRVMIGMRGWTHRAAVLDVIEQLGAEVVYSTGGPPAGYMEAHLGEYCQVLKGLEQY